MAALNFNAANVAPDEGRAGAIPAGWYPVSAIKSEMKPTSTNTGSYLNMQFEVLDGPHKGSKIYHRFNMTNPNAQAVDIGQKQLSALCHAVGVMQVQESSQLHNRPLFVKLKVTPAQGQYEASNEINAFRSANDAAAIAGFQGGGAPAPVASIAPPPVVPAAPSAPQQWAQPAQAAQPAPQAAQPAPAAWAPPAAQQPWGGAQAPASQAQAPAPNVQPATTAMAPVTSTPTQPSAPAVAEQPAWANAAPVQAAAPGVQAAAQAATPEPQVPAAVPPWMQQQAPV